MNFSHFGDKRGAWSGKIYIFSHFFRRNIETFRDRTCNHGNPQSIHGRYNGEFNGENTKFAFINKYAYICRQPTNAATFIQMKPYTLIYNRRLIATTIATALMLITAIGSINAQTAVRWHNEANDTTRITKLLSSLPAGGAEMPANSMMVAFGRMLTGTPYGAGTLETEPEMLTVNLDSLDCMTFVETVAALTITLSEGRNSWQDFVYNLGQLRYRQGHVNGYGSRLHYLSDWVVDNTHLGSMSEVTDRIPGVAYQVKTLDFMSRHRNDYPAMRDDATYEKIKDCELGYRSHRSPYMRSNTLMGKKTAGMLREGDIIAFTTKTEGLDVSHVGIIVITDGEPHVIHASSKAGKVIEDPLTLAEYLKRNHNITGARFIRIGSQR